MKRSTLLAWFGITLIIGGSVAQAASEQELVVEKDTWHPVVCLFKNGNRSRPHVDKTRLSSERAVRITCDAQTTVYKCADGIMPTPVDLGPIKSTDRRQVVGYQIGVMCFKDRDAEP